jgi:glutamine amidotransferase
MQFVHSFYAQPSDHTTILSYSEYGGVRYASSVKKNNIIGIQFHPEKSAEQGLKIYESWANFINKKSY